MRESEAVFGKSAGPSGGSWGGLWWLVGLRRSESAVSDFLGRLLCNKRVKTRKQSESQRYAVIFLQTL